MSKIDELIQELCPDGVAFAALKEVAEFRTGWTFPVSEQGLSVGDYPFYKVADMNNSVMLMGSAQNYISKETAKKLRCKPAPKGTIIFPKIGAAMGTNKKRILSVDSCYDNNAIGIIAKSVDSSYLYYIFSSLTLLDFANGTGAVPSLDKTRLENYKVPLPPLPIQQEIVRILDSFTELTAELTAKLTAELTARRKQYEYYRDELLTFGDEVPRIPLGEVGPVCMCKRILKSQTNDVGGVPFYKVGTFGKQANAYISKETYEEYRNKYNFPKKGDILISAAGTIGRTVVYDGEPAYFQDSNIVWVANDETKILNRFLIHCYAMKPWYVSTGGTIARLYNDNILKAVVPVPSLERQKFIVDTLDRFDTLCNDLTSGLPAEIAARQKQYEYYRDKLLTFKELEG